MTTETRRPDGVFIGWAPHHKRVWRWCCTPCRQSRRTSGVTDRQEEKARQQWQAHIDSREHEARLFGPGGRESSPRFREMDRLMREPPRGAPSL